MRGNSKYFNNFNFLLDKICHKEKTPLINELIEHWKIAQVANFFQNFCCFYQFSTIAIDWGHSNNRIKAVYVYILKKEKGREEFIFASWQRKIIILKQQVKPKTVNRPIHLNMVLNVFK